MKCLVTGAAGFIGSHLAEALVEAHHDVLGVDSFSDYYSKSLKVANLKALKTTDDFRFAEVDLSVAPLSGYVEDVDLIFHLAAQPGVRGSWGDSFTYYVRDNITATQRLLEACKNAKPKRFIYASSSSVYGDAEQFPTVEETKPQPVSPYGATKLESEYLCDIYRRNHGVPAVILRYFTVYGPRQRPDMLFTKFFNAIEKEEEIPIYGDGNQARDFTFVSDTVAATLLSAEAEPGSVYNVGTGTVVTINDALSLLDRILGRVPKVRRLPRAPGDVKRTCADTSKIRKDLGFEPKVDFEAGLRRQATAQAGGQRPPGPWP